MTLRDIRTKAVERMELEIIHLGKELTKMKGRHDSLNQKLFDTVRNLDESPSSSQLLRETERLKQDISDIVVSIHHMDARISRIKHRAERLRRIG